MSLEKIKQTKAILQSVFYHEDYYTSSLLACFASRSHLLIEGFRGSGKTHVEECLVNTIDPEITARQQGYLSLEVEDVFARPDLPALMQGKEEVVWKKMVGARVKFYDEIQRMGVGALSIMFKVLQDGKVQYMDQEMGVDPYWVLATANPTEIGTDTLNIALPEPLFDRFDACVWLPIAPLKFQIKINGGVDKAKRAIRPVWSENEVLGLWRECEQVTISKELDYIMTLINRVLGFCQHAQDYDASSLEEAKKRELCSKCSSSYICSRIARPASVRAKLSLERLSKGFAYIRGSEKVELGDVEKAFPLVYWRRLTLMNEDEVADRLKAMRDLFKMVRKDILEVQDAIKLIENLKKRYDEGEYKQVKEYVNSKAWFVEVLADLDDYYEETERKLKAKAGEARVANDLMLLAKISRLATAKFPPDLAKGYEFTVKWEIELTPENQAKLASLDKNLFERARNAKRDGLEKMTLEGEDAVKWLLK